MNQPVPPPPGPTNSVRMDAPHGIALATTVAALMMFIAPAPDGVTPELMRGAALAIFSIGLYATGVVAEAVTALAFFAIAMLFQVAPASIVFQGFQTTAMWLATGGLIIGVAVERTGLGARLAAVVTARLGTSYGAMVGGLIIVGMLLTLVMPGTLGRVLIMIPIVTALADRLGFEPGSRGRSGLILAMVCGTWMPSSAVLPSNVPNMVLVGVAETLFDIRFNYGDYMLLHLPAVGLARAMLIYAVVVALFKDDARPVESAIPERVSASAPLTAGGRRLAIALMLTLGFWITDFWHGVSPAWIALTTAVFCLMPGVGVVAADDLKRVNFASAIYVAGILSLGVVISETGVGKALGGFLLAYLPLTPGQDLANFMSLAALGTLISTVTTAPGLSAVLGPLAPELAASAELPLATVLMSLVIGHSTVLLPYQVPPLIIAMRLGGVPLRDGARVTLSIAAVTLVILTPLNYFWWRLLGYFG